MGTAGRKMAGSAGDPKIDLVRVFQAPEAFCQCTKGNTDPADLVITGLIYSDISTLSKNSIHNNS